MERPPAEQPTVMLNRKGNLRRSCRGITHANDANVPLLLHASTFYFRRLWSVSQGTAMKSGW
jgi:hypothetical protein